MDSTGVIIWNLRLSLVSFIILFYYTMHISGTINDVQYTMHISGTINDVQYTMHICFIHTLLFLGFFVSFLWGMDFIWRTKKTTLYCIILTCEICFCVLWPSELDPTNTKSAFKYVKIVELLHQFCLVLFGKYLRMICLFTF